MKPAKINEEDLPPVVYMCGEDEIDLVQRGFRRAVRRLLTSEGEKIRRKYGHLKHPETGERPTVVLHVTEEMMPKVTARLVTDSEVLRAWLKEQGIVIEEVVKGQPATAATDVETVAA